MSILVPRTQLLTRLAYVISWLLFLIAVDTLNWDNAKPMHVLLGALVFPGTLVSAIWLVRPGRWVFGALLMSSITVLLYLYWWGMSISASHAADPTPGLLHEIASYFQFRLQFIKQLFSRSHHLLAASQLYWLLLMGFVQAAFLIPLVLSARSLPKAAERPMSRTSHAA